MEGLVVLLALIPVALLILAIVTASRTGSIAREVDALRKELAAMRKLLGEQGAAPRVTVPPAVAPPPPVAPPAPAPPPVAAPEPWYTGMQEPMPRVLEASTSGPAEVKPDHAQSPPRVVVTRSSAPAPMAEVVRPVVAAPPPPRPPTPPPPPRKGAWERFLESNPDLEKFIGENLINKIGIAILVLGLGFLMRYAIGKNYINEVGRVLIGVGAGATLMYIAHRLRTKLRAFSSVLLAGGLSVLYFTITIAYQQYELFTQPQAFAIMVVITALAVVFSVAYDRRELAVIALIGGFAAPFMVSKGDGNFKVLFTYLLILDAGMLVLALIKRWNIVHLVAYGLTLIVFGAWAAGPYTGLEPRPWSWGFVFATCFHLVFFAMAVVYNLRHRLQFRPLEFGLLVSNTAGYYAAGMHFLSDAELYAHPKWTGLFTAALGLFHAVFAFVFYRRQQVPRNLVLLLIGLALTLCTLAVPVQLEGYTITLFWAAEAVLLVWFAQRAGLPLVQRGAVIVALLGLISLLMDIDAFYNFLRPELPPLVNAGWITGMVVVASMVALWWLWKRQDARGDELAMRIVPGVGLKPFATTALVIAIGLGYLLNLLELRNQSAKLLSNDGVRMATMVFTLLYALGVDFFTRKEAVFVRRVVFALAALVLVVYVTGFYQASRTSLEEMLLGSARGFGIHYAALACCVVLVVRTALLARTVVPRPSQGWSIYLWAMCAYLVVLASQELDHLMVLVNHEPGQSMMTALRKARRAGYPILWGVGSFLFMWYGMRNKLKTVRIIALVLFGITLVKLFMFDLRGISEGGKVAAFICLGILLLVVSFMYNKLKGLFVDDGEAVKP